jgi:VWFA-related protein
VFFGLMIGFGIRGPGQSARDADSKVTIESRTGKPQATASPRGYQLSVQSTMVLIPVTVTDASNHFVLGLKKGSFQIFEDNQPQDILSFSNEDTPVSVGLVLDRSGSMRDKSGRSLEAARELLRAANPQDEFLLVEFNSTAELVQPFTRNPEDIQDSLLSKRPTGATALLDSVYRAMLEMKKAQNPRKALLLISDGGENHSRYKEREIKNLVRESDVQVYTVGVYGSLLERLGFPEQVAGPRLLRWLADETGGRHYEIRSMDELADAAARVRLLLRNQYVIGYSPTNQRQDGTYRRVQVKLDTPASSPVLHASWRSGYYSPGR